MFCVITTGWPGIYLRMYCASSRAVEIVKSAVAGTDYQRDGLTPVEFGAGLGSDKGWPEKIQRNAQRHSNRHQGGEGPRRPDPRGFRPASPQRRWAPVASGRGAGVFINSSRNSVIARYCRHTGKNDQRRRRWEASTSADAHRATENGLKATFSPSGSRRRSHREFWVIVCLACLAVSQFSRSFVDPHFYAMVERGGDLVDMLDDRSATGS